MIDYAAIEAKWKQYWRDHKIYKAERDSSKPKYYVLDMFPYPSGAGLHVGHPLGYIASDIFSRYKRMNGFNVLHPMGFDAFGLPAEEYALQTGIHPAVSTKDNMERYRQQLQSLGFSFDWSREVYTCDPNYYKWTQWIFCELFNHYYDQNDEKAKPINHLIAIFEKEGNGNVQASHSQKEVFTAAQWNAFSKIEQEDILMNYRLAYRKLGYVNWCEELGTVLANDQIKDGVTERGGYPVTQKAMAQWYLRITAYADRLLSGLDSLDWSNSLKAMQSNWIGKSEGASIVFKIEGSQEVIEVFTTRPDTIFGATYMVLAPEHELVSQLTTPECQDAVNGYLAYAASKSEIDRMAEKKVTGQFIGAYAINPYNEEKIPIWIGEYVLKDYGTGAIMAVPSDDERDNAFAKKFNIPIVDVVDKSKYPGASLHDKLGVIINSGFLNGLEVPEAIKLATQKAEEWGIGKGVSNYKMRDANFSRQRYWGEPFPVIYDKDGIAKVLTVDELPLILPDTEEFKPTKGGKSPLARLTDWVQMSNGMTRETDTMPAVAGSSWYYLRYMDPQNPQAFASQADVNYWQDVDLYVGGAEHAVAHLLYARFWHKFLYDLKLVPTEEPFKKLINQGMIQGVIESIYLEKNTDSAERTFYSSDMIDSEDAEKYAKIPVHIDFVANYGSPQSHLNLEGINKFIAWRPSYQNAVFVSKQGSLQNGKMITGESGEDFGIQTISEVGKMSKSKFNVVNPDDVISKYGTDCFRMYEMFLGPIEQSKPWDINGIDGVSKFLRKFIDLFYSDEKFTVSDEPADKEEFKILHSTIKKLSEDITAFSFNTSVAALMICVNELRKKNCNKREILSPLVQILAPFAPFISEELWEQLGNKGSVHQSQFPSCDEKYLVEDSVNYPICINGKKRGLKEFSKNLTQEQIIEQVKSLDYLDKWLEGNSIKKIIVVPDRMINIVI